MSLTNSRSARRKRALIAAALGISALGVLPLATSPAYADTVTTADGASVTVADVVAGGTAIHIEGTGWKHPSNGTGSTVAVKLGGALTTEPKAGPVTNPATGTSADDFDIWSAIEANDDGSFSADIPFPTPDNTAPALASPWAVGTQHTLQLLTGSMESGDQARGALITFTIGQGLVSTATTAADGKITVALSGGSFTPGEVLSVKQGATARQWTVTSGRTSTVSDTLTVGAAGTITASVVLPAGTAPAGPVTLTITGTQGANQNVTATAPPSVAFGNGTALGATGTLTLGNLAAGTTISSVTLGGQSLATNLTADGSGVATAPYTIPASLSPTTQSLVITQTAPEARTYTLSQAVYPNESASGLGRFDVTSSTDSFYQGFYQSAYSPAQDALYVTASDRGTGTNGFIYKLDPDTLAIEASISTTNPDFAKAGAFGIGVDDAHGHIWVTNTGSASVAIYDESDLSLVKQFDANTITHPRDIVYDPSTDLVFASSASEGSSATATGYISVFEADDKDGDGTKYEKLTDIQTGTRDVFNPVSLSLANGKLFSPSLGSSKVVSIDTAHVLDAGYAPTFLSIDGIDVGGRGASGIAYDAADDRLFIASQNSNEVVVADATTGATIKEVPTGRQALNVVFDPVHKLAYVANFGGTSVTVLDKDGNKVGALPIATANHVSTDGRGDVYVVDKASPANKVWKITPRIETVDDVDVLDPSSTAVTGNAATTPLSVTVTQGQAIHLEGTNFRIADGTSGSKIAVKPASVPGSPTIAEVEADADGTWSVDVPFPSDWVAGDSQHLRLLTGSLKTGDTIRSIAVKVHVEAAATSPGGSTGGGGGGGATTTPDATDAPSTDAPSTAPVPTAPAATPTPSTPTATTPTGLKSTTPKVTGAARVGHKLIAGVGSWSAGTKLSYQWYANGKPIKGATKRAFTITKKQQGQKITVKVTGTKKGYAKVVKTSRATGKVAR